MPLDLSNLFFYFSTPQIYCANPRKCALDQRSTLLLGGGHLAQIQEGQVCLFKYKQISFLLPNLPYLELLLCYLIYNSLSLSSHSFSCYSSSQVLEYSSPRSIYFGNKIQEALEDNKKSNAYACFSYAYGGNFVVFSFMNHAILDLE